MKNTKNHGKTTEDVRLELQAKLAATAIPLVSGILANPATGSVYDMPDADLVKIADRALNLAAEIHLRAGLRAAALYGDD